MEKILKEKINLTLDLTRIKTGASKLKHIRNSGIFMATNSNIDALEKEINEKLGDELKVIKPRVLAPQLIISGLTHEYSAEDLWLEIRETNHGFDEDDKISVVYHIRNWHLETKKNGLIY